MPDSTRKQPRGMFLQRLALKYFRICRETTLTFDPYLTVLCGANASGKSSVIDAIRLVTDPVHGRRDIYASEEDIAWRSGDGGFTITADFAGLDKHQTGQFVTAMPDVSGSDARYTFRYTAPAEGKRLGRWRVTPGVGTEEASEPEPEARGLLRHVYLPPLRDAQRVLSSGDGQRIRFLIKRLASAADVAELETCAASTFADLEDMPAITDAFKPVASALNELTEGVRSHGAALRFEKAELSNLARMLRFWLTGAGADYFRPSEAGLGYANLLYIANVLVELQAAQDAELTVFLVEEPEAHLHPQLQATVLDFLKREAERSALRERAQGHPAGRIQVVATTHSPNLTSAVSVQNLVVLRGEMTSGATSQMAGNLESASEPPADGVPRVVGAHALAVRDLGLDPKVVRKVDRYLTVTRSALAFSDTVILVEGIAEAILLPVFAKRVLCPPGGNAAERSAAWSRFVAGTVVAIDGVDFEPYVRFLLTGVDGHTIARHVIVLTDEDNGEGNQREAALREIATELGATERLTVRLVPQTLEAELVASGNEGIAKAAFLKERPRSEEKWNQNVAALPQPERPAAVVELLKTSRVRKGDFAQQFGSEFEEHEGAVVPHVISYVIKLVAGER